MYADEATGSKAAYLRLTQTVYPNGRTVNYNYATGVNAMMSRLSSISESNGTVDASYKYLGLGTIVKENYEQPDIKLDYDPNANNSLTGLDRFGRVIDQLWASYNSTPNPLEEYTYAFDRAGNANDRTNVNHAALNDHFVYDAVNRLTEWDEGSPLVQQKTWSLDALGNDLGSGTYNAANEETPTQGSSGLRRRGQHDDAQVGQDGEVRRLEPAGRGGQRRDDRRAERIRRRGPPHPDFQQLHGRDVPARPWTSYRVASRRSRLAQNSAVEEYQYVWSPRYIDAPDPARTRTAAAASHTAQRIFYLSDANYNVTAVVKQNSVSGLWNVVERYSYTPYGVVTFRNADWSVAGSSANANTILYTGRTYDTLTSLYYYRARYYDPALERFVNRDPIGILGGPNAYVYCGNSPTTFVDPSGLDYRDDYIAVTPNTPNSWPIHHLYQQADSLAKRAEKELGVKVHDLSNLRAVHPTIHKEINVLQQRFWAKQAEKYGSLEAAYASTPWSEIQKFHTSIEESYGKYMVRARAGASKFTSIESMIAKETAIAKVNRMNNVMTKIGLAAGAVAALFKLIDTARLGANIANPSPEQQAALNDALNQYATCFNIALENRLKRMTGIYFVGKSLHT